jgi:hypothetical protein
LITAQSQKEIYIGGTLNLRSRFSTQFAVKQLEHWQKRWNAESISFIQKPEVTDPIDLLSMQKRLIKLAAPILNDLGPAAA